MRWVVVAFDALMVAAIIGAALAFNRVGVGFAAGAAATIYAVSFARSLRTALQRGD